MKVRKIIKIDEELCNGCGNCVLECHEMAIQIVDGKAKVINDQLCDGIGDCIGSCPLNAISFEERLAPAYDALLVKQHIAKSGGGCPGSAAFSSRNTAEKVQLESHNEMCGIDSKCTAVTDCAGVEGPGHWPLKIRLAPAQASFFADRQLVIAADCAAFIHPDFHKNFANGTALLIGCPKFENTAMYTDKLAQIFAGSTPSSITVVRMEVPCCRGLIRSVEEAVKLAAKDITVTEKIVKI